MVRSVAQDEMANLKNIAAWCRRNPDGLLNPCWNLHGGLAEIWPDADFTGDLLAPKRASLKLLTKDPCYDLPLWRRTPSP